MSDTPRTAAGNTGENWVCPLLAAHFSDLPSTQPGTSGLENRWENCRILPQCSAYYGETGALEWVGGREWERVLKALTPLYTQLDNKKLVTRPRVPPVIVLENQGLQWVPKDKNL